MKYLITLFALWAGCISYSQNSKKEIDSLLKVAQTANDSTRLRIQNKASFFYIYNDSDRASKMLPEAIQEAQVKGHYFSTVELTNTYGIYFDVTGKTDSARYYFEKALDLSKEYDFQGIKAMVTNNLGMFNWNKGAYQEALKYFFEAVEINEQAPEKNKNKEAVYFNNIGLIYQEMGQIDKALAYHKKSLAIREREKILNEIPASLNNIAISLREKGQYAEAELTAKEAMERAETASATQYYLGAANTLANIYINLGNYRDAVSLHQEIIEKRDDLGMDRNANLASISDIIVGYNYLKEPQNALPYVLQGEAHVAEFPELKNDMIGFYAGASEVYFRMNQPDKGTEYLNKSLSIKDRIFSANNATSLAALETKFKVAEKERNLAETRANLAESELEVKQRNNVIMGSLSLAVILGLLGFLFYNQQKLKNHQLKKEGDLKEALARIETQNKLQEQRLRISRDLHDNIGSQLTFVTSSVDNLKYGLKDTDTTLTSKLGKISEFTTQTIYELRDTIWAMNKTEISMEDLQTRIANFIDNAGKASQAVHFSFTVAEGISKETLFTSLKGMNIYRIIQEAVNNALKYGESSVISVQLKKNDKAYLLQISDDGKGFDLSSAPLGNGLNNIKKRARDLGGEASITSEIEKGTLIEVKFSLE